MYGEPVPYLCYVTVSTNYDYYKLWIWDKFLVSKANIYSRPFWKLIFLPDNFRMRHRGFGRLYLLLIAFCIYVKVLCWYQNITAPMLFFYRLDYTNEICYREGLGDTQTECKYQRIKCLLIVFQLLRYSEYLSSNFLRCLIALNSYENITKKYHFTSTTI